MKNYKTYVGKRVGLNNVINAKGTIVSMTHGVAYVKWSHNGNILPHFIQKLIILETPDEIFKDLIQKDLNEA